MSKTNDTRPPAKNAGTHDAAPATRKRVAGVAKATKSASSDDMQGERIAKAMARAGLCSRREAEIWIADGRVSVNGKVLDTPAVTVSTSDRVVVDGQPLPLKERTRLFLYHKPRGLVTTTHDPEGRPTVFEALPEDMPRVVTVGRLDINTEGLLLLTNDGGLARVLELPATGWLRRYRVRAFGTVTQEQLDSLKEGVTIEGISYGSVEAQIDTVKGANVWLLVGLREGKNREVKRILQHLGLTVNRLIRVSFGPFQLVDLEEGEIREIRGKVLRDQLGKRLVDESGADFEAPIIHHIAGGENDGQQPAPGPAPRAKTDAGGRVKRSNPRTQLEFLGTDEDGSRQARIDREGKASVSVKYLAKSREVSREKTVRDSRSATRGGKSDGPRDRSAPRQDGERPARAARPPRDAQAGADARPPRTARPPRDSQAGADARPPRTARPAGDRPRGERVQGERAQGERAQGERSFSEARGPRSAGAGKPMRSEGFRDQAPSRGRGRPAGASDEATGATPRDGGKPYRSQGMRDRPDAGATAKPRGAGPSRGAPRAGAGSQDARPPRTEGNRPPRAEGARPPRGRPAGDGADRGPRSFAPRGAGSRDSGPRDSGPREAGSRDAGPRDFGARGAGKPGAAGKAGPGRSGAPRSSGGKADSGKAGFDKPASGKPPFGKPRGPGKPSGPRGGGAGGGSGAGGARKGGQGADRRR